MKYKSFKEYLLANNLTDKLTKEELANLQSQWRKAYQKWYHKTYGQKRIRKTIALSPSEDRQFEKAAQRHHMKSGEFMKYATLAYLNKSYVVPNEEQIYEVIMQLRKIGTNINQVAKFVNSRQVIMGEELDLIYKQLFQLENSIEQELRQPDTLEEKLEKMLEKDPSYEVKIERVIQQHKNKTKK